jgi:3-hydroxyacyl-CoA dehydrogenase / enoyl-CoA hydratase / 3-hydroxybutyryl-CoA epimerase
MVLSGRTLKAPVALQKGLVDRVTRREELLEAALALLRNPAPARQARTRKRSGWRCLLLEKNPIGRTLLFRRARQTLAKKTGGHYPAPETALQVMRRGLRLPLAKGLRLEAENLGEIATGTVCKNLIYLYRLSERAKKGVPAEKPLPPVQRAAVLGAGVMGVGIAQLLAEHGIEVVLKDIEQDRVDAGLERIREHFARQRGTDQAGSREKLERVTGSVDHQGLAGVDLVIEAIVEKMSIKQQVLAETEKHLNATAVFASNTSALSITTLQQAAARPEKVGGMHFFNPVERMPLVEIIRGESSSSDTTAQLFATALRLGKTPILVADHPGFLVNRLLMVYLLEACLVVAEGCTWASLEVQAKDFGFPMGPFRLLDEVGLDIAAEAGATLLRAFPYLPENSLLEKVVGAGLTGRKGGKGFYHYAEGREAAPNEELSRIVQLPATRTATAQDWRRLLLVMLNETGRCLQGGVVGDGRDVDTGLVFGAGFPPFRGGLCRWADREGLPLLVKELESLAASHGERFIPSSYLLERSSLLT